MPRWIQTKSALIPLIVMLSIGGGWWGLTYFATSDDVAEVRVETVEWEYAVSDLEAALGREIDAEEQALLLDRMVDDEILLHEGMRAAPWATDPVIRRRLVELVSFFDIGDRTGNPIAGFREALFRRAAHYEIQIDGEDFDIARSFSQGKE